MYLVQYAHVHVVGRGKELPFAAENIHLMSTKKNNPRMRHPYKNDGRFRPMQYHHIDHICHTRGDNRLVLLPPWLHEVKGIHSILHDVKLSATGACSKHNTWRACKKNMNEALAKDLANSP